MTLSVIGTGYVGLVSAACLSEKGQRVICVDIDADRVDQVNRAVPVIHERGLPRLLQRNVPVRLRATTNIAAAVMASDVSMITVGTPFDGTAIDLSSVVRAARDIGKVLRHKREFHVVVVKSTVVPGTTEEVVRPVLEEASGKRAGIDFGLGMNPEFLREGEAVQDFMHPDRIVLGGIDARTLDAMASVYSAFDGMDVMRTSTRTAEMIKYASNALLATLISYANEIGNLCAALGDIDVADVMRGVHLDRRFSPLLADGTRLVPGFTSYLQAGCGFGGSCFPKDVKALIAHGRKAGVAMRVLAAVMAVNDRQPREMLRLLRKHFSSLSGTRVAVLGMAFKPGTDDVRESPAVPLIRALQDGGASVRAYDPAARRAAEKVLGNGNITYCESLEAAVHEVDAVMLMTRWQEFSALSELLAGAKRQPIVIDGRRMLDKQLFSRYEGIGLTAARGQPMSLPGYS